MKPKWSVRAYREGDKEDIFNIWKHRFDENCIPKRKELFHLMVEKNPYLSGESPYTVIEYDGKIIGFCGRMPVRFLVNGEITDAFISHDTMVHPDFRGKGLAGEMVQYQIANSKSFVGALWFTKGNHRAYQKTSFIDVEGLYPFLKIFNIDFLITQKFNYPIMSFFLRNVGNSILKLLSLRINGNKDSKLEIKKMESFNSAFDQFSCNASKKLGLIALRGSEYLNWKYVNKPYMKYSIYAANESNRILGYIVFRTSQLNGYRKKGMIVDILVEPDRLDVFKEIVLRALKDLKNENVDYVECVVTYPPFRNLLRKMGFIRYWKSMPFMVANWQSFFPKDYVTDIRNWYITYGDSDYDFWEVSK